MKPKDLRAIAKVCREMGITHYKQDGVSIEFRIEALPTSTALPEQSKGATPETPDAPTEESVLFWSAGAPL